MYRSLITAVSLITLLGAAPAFAATSSASNQPKPAYAISKVTPVKPAGKHTRLRGTEKRHLAKTLDRHGNKASVKIVPSKEMPKKSAG